METKPTLNYLFVAQYKDGTMFAQPDDDKSARDEKRSAFYDIDQENLDCFFLTNGKDVYMVDMNDGHFEANQASFNLVDQEFTLVNPLRLVYYRETVVNSEISPEGEEVKREHFVRRYFMGWQTTDKDGKNVVKTISVS